MSNINQNKRKPSAKLIEQKRRNSNKKHLIILLTPLVATLIVIAIMLYSMDLIKDYKFESNAYQYYLGNKYAINSGAKLVLNEERAALEFNGVKNDISNLPIYFEDEKAIICSEDTIYINPRTLEFYRIPRFTKIKSNRGNIVAIHNDDEVNLKSGFVYDGNNLYIFLEPMKVTINGYAQLLPELSYVEATYMYETISFNCETLDCFNESTKYDSIAYQENGDYTINLLSDSYSNYDGITQLLYTNPADLKTIFEQ